jgi:glycosyltransferase involved in cell wall biosynthesis
MSKRIKVIQVLEQYGEAYQPYIPPVIQRLKHKEELEVLVYTTEPCKSENVDFNTSHLKRELNKLAKIFFKKSLINELNFVLKNSPDIIHLQHSFLYPKFLKIFDKPTLSRPKIVITLRGADTYLRPWHKIKWRSFYKEYGNEVDAFITVSNNQKKYLTKWGVEPSRIHVIPISFGEKSVALPKQSIEGEIRIISAHRMTWEKNIDGNLRTVKEIIELGEKVRYDIYGDGRDASQVYYLIDKYQLNDIATYHGKISNDRLKEKLKSSDIFLQLSHSESFGASVIEAQSMGLPAIISDSDGMPETIINGQTGYTFNPWNIESAADAIIKLKKDSVLFHNFSEAAIENVNSNFTYNNEVNKLFELYTNLVNK